MEAKGTKKAGMALSRSCPYLGCRKRQIYRLALNSVIDHFQIFFYNANMCAIFIFHP